VRSITQCVSTIQPWPTHWRKKYVESKWQEDKVKQRYDWIFEYDAMRAEEMPSMPVVTAVT
jgi:pyruvate/2-oxoacid:ferredoxin oxidoreductase beta subunit